MSRTWCWSRRRPRKSTSCWSGGSGIISTHRTKRRGCESRDEAGETARFFHDDKGRRRGMAEFLSPGHFKSEEKPGIVQIQGVPVGTIALLVETERGPEYATRVTGWNQFITRYGGVKPGSFAAETVWA